MKVIISALLFCFSQVSCGQEIDYNGNDLSKFSYLIFGRYNNNRLQAYNGTCFYVNYKGNTFLVTAGHNVNQWNYINGSSIGDPPDSVSVFVGDYDSGDWTFFHDKASNFLKLVKQGFGNEYPDLSVTKLRRINDKRINQIQFQEEDYNDKTPVDSVCAYGYPNLVEGIPLLQVVRSKPKLITSNLCEHPNKKLYWIVNKKFDTVNFRCQFNLQGSIKGMSGSPVFVRKKNSQRLIFGGLLFAGGPDDGLVYLVRPEYIIRRIKELSSADEKAQR